MSAHDKVFLLGHAVAAGVLVGSSTHLALQALKLARGRVQPRLLRVYPPVAFVSWALTFALGAWVYPSYRIEVRHAYLDYDAVWASVLFDIKENLAVFVGPLLAAAWLMSRAVSEEADRGIRAYFTGSCVLAAVISWWNLLSGLLVGSMKSV